MGLALDEVSFTLSQCTVGLCSEDGDDPTTYPSLPTLGSIVSMSIAFQWQSTLDWVVPMFCWRHWTEEWCPWTCRFTDPTAKSFECKHLAFTQWSFRELAVVQPWEPAVTTGKQKADGWCCKSRLSAWDSPPCSRLSVYECRECVQQRCSRGAAVGWQFQALPG